MADSRAALLERLCEVIAEVPDGMYPEPLAWERIKAAYVAVEQAAPERARCSACGEPWSHHRNPNRCPRQELADACAAILEADAMLIRRPYTVGYPDYVAWLALPAVVEARKGER